MEYGNAVPLRDVILPEDSFVTFRGLGRGGFFIGAPGHPIFRRAAQHATQLALTNRSLCNPKELWCYTTKAWCVAVREELGLPLQWNENGTLAMRMEDCSLPDEYKGAAPFGEGTAQARVVSYSVLDGSLGNQNWKAVQKQEGGTDYHADEKRGESLPILFGPDEKPIHGPPNTWTYA